MNKYSQLKDFEKSKLDEIEEFKLKFENQLLSLETEHQQKVKNISQDIVPLREKLNTDYTQKLEQESIQIQKETQKQIENLSISDDTIRAYAQEIAKIITG